MRPSVPIALSLSLIAEPLLAAPCNMPLAQTHRSGTRIYAAGAGPRSIYFAANVDVNTDGAARSYHPQDPLGNGLALNNIVNALTGAWEADGTRINCAPKRGACFMRYVHAFEGARDSGYALTGAPRIATRHIIPWSRASASDPLKPCLIPSGPYAGHFVSQTSFLVDGSKPECDQARYLDSLAFNAAVLPGGAVWKSQGSQVEVGDLVVMRIPATGRIAYGIIGDSGPAASIGEASVAFVAALRGQSVPANASYRAIKRLALPSGQYLIFPATDPRRAAAGPVTQASIDQRARALFEAWGGEARLANCPVQ